MDPWVNGCTTYQSQLPTETKVKIEDECVELTFEKMYNMATVEDHSRRLESEVISCPLTADNDITSNKELSQLADILKETIGSYYSEKKEEFDLEGTSYPLHAIFDVSSYASVFVQDSEVGPEKTLAYQLNRGLYYLGEAILGCEGFSKVPSILQRKNFSGFLNINTMNTLFVSIGQANLSLTWNQIVLQIFAWLHLTPSEKYITKRKDSDVISQNTVKLGTTKTKKVVAKWMTEQVLPGGKFKQVTKHKTTRENVTTHYATFTKSMSKTCAEVTSGSGSVQLLNYGSSNLSIVTTRPVNHFKIPANTKGYLKDIELGMYGMNVLNMHQMGDIKVQPGCSLHISDQEYLTVNRSHTYSVITYNVIPVIFHSYCVKHTIDVNSVYYPGGQFTAITSNTQVHKKTHVKNVVVANKTDITVKQKLVYLKPRTFTCTCEATMAITLHSVKKSFLKTLTSFELYKLPQPMYIIIYVMGFVGGEIISIHCDGSIFRTITMTPVWTKHVIQVKDFSKGLKVISDMKVNKNKSYLFYTASASQGKIVNRKACGSDCALLSQGVHTQKSNTVPLETKYVLTPMDTKTVVKEDLHNGAYLADDDDVHDPIVLEDDLKEKHSGALSSFGKVVQALAFLMV
jgi:hypothetical protein